VFAQYASKAVGPSGALLCCVMNGKLSEGINFSDNLARCVVVVGLPYPNKFDVVLKEKMSFMQQARAQVLGLSPQGHAGESASATAAAALYSQQQSFASQIYENMCMKAINQSIGRSIRHIGDYSAIVVLDKRYCSGSSASGGGPIINQLPKWTTGNGRLKICGSFAQAAGELAEFYKGHGHGDNFTQK
jgi:chromosome transmission fidelity protein 1